MRNHGAMGRARLAMKIAMVAAMLCSSLASTLGPAEVHATPALGRLEQAAPPVFDEHFRDNQAGWPENENRFFDADGYHLVGEPGANGANATWTVQPSRTPRLADIALEAEFVRVDGPDTAGFGLTVRSTTTPRRAYRLFIDGL